MLREIIALFGVQVDDKELKAGEASVNKFKDTLTSVAKVAAGAFAFSSIKNLVTEMVGLGAHLDDMSQRYGVGTDALEKWQYAAKMSGVEAESAGSSLGFLQKNLGLAITNGGASAQAFAAHRRWWRNSGVIAERGQHVERRDQMLAINAARWRDSLPRHDQRYGNLLLKVHHLARPAVGARALAMVAGEDYEGILLAARLAQRVH